MGKEINIIKNSEKILNILCDNLDSGDYDQASYFLKSNKFFFEPASKSHHLSVPGGLAQHSLNTYFALREINRKDRIKNTETSIAICGLLHDVCKLSSHVNLPCGHGEKSVIILQGFMQLSWDEIMAIRWHMGPWDRNTNINELDYAISKCRLLKKLMIADMTASQLWEMDN